MASAPLRFVLPILVVSLLLNLAGLFVVIRSGAWRRFLIRRDLAAPQLARADWQLDEIERYRLLAQVSPGSAILFAGDSLIRGGDWEEVLGTIHNRGIGAERTDGLLARLDAILAERPKALVLLCGANDLAQEVPPTQLLRNYRAILERATRGPEPPRVLVLGVLPLSPVIGPPKVHDNVPVRTVNRQLAPLVGEFPRCRFLDLTPLLADEAGDLRPEFTRDGQHLTVRGYVAIAPRVRAELEEMARADAGQAGGPVP